MHRSILTLCVSLALAAPAVAQCERPFLEDMAARYVATQTSGQVSNLTSIAAANVVYTENQKTATLATGMLSKAQKIDHARSQADVRQCATYTELIITDSKHPYVIGTQMRFTDGKLSKIESIITDQGDWLFNAANTLKYALPEKWDLIPVEKRDTYEVIKAAGDAYCDVFKNKATVVPWGTPCNRLEGGSYTGSGKPTDSCNVGVPSGLDLTNRRYVVDVDYGTVDIMLTFGGTTGLPDTHEFRVESGKLRYVHTMSVQS